MLMRKEKIPTATIINTRSSKGVGVAAVEPLLVDASKFILRQLQQQAAVYTDFLVTIN